MRPAASAGSACVINAAVVSGNCGAADVCSPSVTIALARINPGGRQSARRQRRRDDLAAQDLAGRGQRVEPAGETSRRTPRACTMRSTSSNSRSMAASTARRCGGSVTTCAIFRCRWRRSSEARLGAFHVAGACLRRDTEKPIGHTRTAPTRRRSGPRASPPSRCASA